jgi:hypothetical protein
MAGEALSQLQKRVQRQHRRAYILPAPSMQTDG